MRVSITGEKPDSPEPSPLEAAVIDCALTALGSAGEPLRQQLSTANVVSRTPSGVGFVTRLAIAADSPSAPDINRLPVVHGRHPQLEEPAEFLLQLKSGRLHSIEAYCFDGMWPVDEENFRLLADA